MVHYTEICFFVLFYELKNTFVTSLHFLFLFTNKRAVLSSAQTDQSQFSFSAGFQHEIEHALTGIGFWHQINLAREKYDRLTSFWYQLRCLKLASVSSLSDPLAGLGERTGEVKEKEKNWKWVK